MLKAVRFSLFSVFSVTLLSGSSVCFAQHVGSFGQSANPANKSAYFTSADFSLTSDVSGREVFVGKSDTAVAATNFQTQNPVTPVTLTIATGASTTFTPTTPAYPDGNLYTGVNAFGNNKVAITGGSVERTTGYDTSTTAISGGFVRNFYSNNTSTTSISGGSVFEFYANDNSAVSISGGNVLYANSFENSTMNIVGGSPNFIRAFDDSTVNIYASSNINYGGFGNSVLNVFGGTINDDLSIDETASINIFGTNLNAAYITSVNNSDRFSITGNYGDPAQTPFVLGVAIVNVSGFPNGNLRRVNLLAPIVVPESGALPLIATGAVMILGVRVRRRTIA